VIAIFLCIRLRTRWGHQEIYFAVNGFPCHIFSQNATPETDRLHETDATRALRAPTVFCILRLNDGVQQGCAKQAAAMSSPRGERNKIRPATSVPNPKFHRISPQSLRRHFGDTGATFTTASGRCLRCAIPQLARAACLVAIGEAVMMV
jgi:hypothetical protein